MDNNLYDFDRKDVFDSEVRPLLEKAQLICEENEIPYMFSASVERSGHRFGQYAEHNLNFSLMSERMIAAAAVADESVAFELLKSVSFAVSFLFQRITQRDETDLTKLEEEALRICQSLVRIMATASAFARQDAGFLKALRSSDHDEPEGGSDEKDFPMEGVPEEMQDFLRKLISGMDDA